jgi:hypothetical protein
MPLEPDAGDGPPLEVLPVRAIADDHQLKGGRRGDAPPRLDEDVDALLGRDPADVQYGARARHGRAAPTGVGDEVGLDPDPSRRKPAMHEAFPREFVQGQEEVDAPLPRADAPVQRYAAGGRHREQRRAAVASMPHPVPRVRADAVLARRAVAEELAVRAEQAEVVERHDDRHADPPQAPQHRR